METVWKPYNENNGQPYADGHMGMDKRRLDVGFKRTILMFWVVVPEQNFVSHNVIQEITAKNELALRNRDL